jgi:hypothetical protein
MRILVLCVLLAGCSHPTAAGVSPAPRASGELVDGVWPLIGGDTLDLSRLHGQVVIIHVFATWSLAAMADLDQLRAARAVAPERVTIVSIGLDVDGPRLLIPWRDAAKVDWPIALPSADVKAGRTPLGDVMGAVPETIVLDAGGYLVWRQDGGLGDGVLAAEVKRLLAPPPR